MEEKTNRISANFIIVVGTFALCVDLAQIFLDIILIGIVVNRLIDILMFAGLWIAFRAQGVSFNKTRALVFFGLGFLEMFPGADAFPLWTVDVIAVAMLANMEDRLGIGGKSIVENPRTRAILKKGIMKATNRTVGRSALLRNTLNDQNQGKWDKQSRLGSGRPATNPTRDAKIAAQREQKQNANENEQQTAV